MSDGKRAYRRQSGPCRVDGCGRDAVTGGLCTMHDTRMRRHGSTEPRSRKRPPRPCKRDGCRNPAVAKRLCNTHYVQVRRALAKGETLPPFRWNGWGAVTVIEIDADIRPSSHVQDANAERWRVRADGHPIGWLLARENGVRRFDYETPDDPPDTIRPFTTITRSKAVENLLTALDM
jgi:hypothetical protein